MPQVEIDEQYGYVYAKILSNRPNGEKSAGAWIYCTYGYFSLKYRADVKLADYPSV